MRITHTSQRTAGHARPQKKAGSLHQAPCPPWKSNKEAANALAAAHDKMEYHRNLHACSKRRCNTGGSDLTRAFANIWTNVRASLDQRPPTSSPGTTKRALANELRVRGFLAPTGSPKCHTIPVSSTWHWLAISPNCRDEGCVHGELDPAKQWQAVGNNLQPLVIVGIALGTPRSKSRTN